MIRRIITQPTKVLDRRAAYWQGQRCEAIVAARIAERIKEKAERRFKRNLGGTKGSTRSAATQLRRLERALKKRVTPAGIAAVSARIVQLKSEMAKC
jgi:hypothetical protein